MWADQSLYKTEMERAHRAIVNLIAVARQGTDLPRPTVHLIHQDPPSDLEGEAIEEQPLDVDFNLMLPGQQMVVAMQRRRLRMPEEAPEPRGGMWFRH